MNGDTKFELDEAFNVNLTAPSGATLGDGIAVGTINNDDAPPTVSITDVNELEGNSGTTAFVFTAQLSSVSTVAATVDARRGRHRHAADNDYTAASATLTFPPGVTSQTFTVLVNGDTKYELNETFGVNLANPTGTTVVDGAGVGTITNDDPQPVISITDVSHPEGNAGATPFVFTVQLSNASSQTVSVMAATANGTATTIDNDYASNTQPVTFVPGVTSQTFIVVGNGDLTVESDEAFTVRCRPRSRARSPTPPASARSPTRRRPRYAGRFDRRRRRRRRQRRYDVIHLHTGADRGADLRRNGVGDNGQRHGNHGRR